MGASTEGVGELPRLLGVRYELVGLLGEGGTCQVFTARHVELGRLVAVKVPHPRHCEDRVHLARLLREARTCAALRHPNIVEVYDVDEVDGIPFIAMQLVRGPTLHDLLHRRLERRRGLALLLDVARALVYAHGHGVVHRDLKPGNVLVDEAAERALVVDWGLARAQHDHTGLTRTGMLVGTPQYMAPEQVTSGSCSPAADWYALGTCCFELLTGRLPFIATSIPDLLACKIRHPAPPVASCAADVPTDLAALVDGLLAVAPEGRADPAADVVATLARHAGVAPPASVELTAPRIPARRPFWFARVAVLALLVVAAGFALFRGSAGPPIEIDARLDGPLRVLVQLPRDAAGVVTVTVRGDGSSVAYGQVTSTVAALPLAGGRRLCTVDAATPVIGPASVEASLGGRTGRRTVDGAAVVRRLLHRVAALDDDPDRWHGFIKALQDERTRLSLASYSPDRAALRAERAPVFTELLDGVGLDRRTCAELAVVLPALLVGPDARADGELAEQLVPLRFIETLLSEWDGFEVPWGHVAACLGIRWQHYEGRRAWASSPRLAEVPVVGMHGTREKWIYLVPQQHLEAVRANPFLHATEWTKVTALELHRISGGADAADEVVPSGAEFRSHWRTTFDMPLPEDWPRPVRLELVVRVLTYYLILEAKVNDGRPVTFTNTVVLAKRDGTLRGKSSALGSYVLSAPISPDVLRRGNNAVGLVVRSIEPLRADTPLAIGGIRIVLAD